jgi:hypothetical protein
MHKLLVATRIHTNSSSSNTLPTIPIVVKFIQGCALYSEKILLCIGISNKIYFDNFKETLTVALKQENLSDKFIIIHIEPWGYFTNALNKAIQIAQDLNFERIAFQVYFKILF